jgi:RNA polymerase sigma-70 factor, ECF subfamily
MSGRQGSECLPGPARDLPTASDNDLAQELMRENHEALAVLIDRYQRLVFTIAIRIVHDPGEAEDLVQVVFLEIFRKAKLFDPNKGSLKVWLLRYAYTRSMNRREQLEHRGFYTNAELDEARPLFLPHRAMFDGSLSVQEGSRFIQQMLDKVSSNQRRAIELIALQGLTLQEAAKAMDLSLAATRNHYYRGILALRAFCTNQPAEVEREQPITVEDGTRGVAHLKARPA